MSEENLVEPEVEELEIYLESEDVLVKMFKKYIDSVIDENDDNLDKKIIIKFGTLLLDEDIRDIVFSELEEEFECFGWEVDVDYDNDIITLT